MAHPVIPLYDASLKKFVGITPPICIAVTFTTHDGSTHSGYTGQLESGIYPERRFETVFVAAPLEARPPYLYGLRSTFVARS